MTTGYIYALSNEDMPGLLKIGMTERRPEERAKQLFTTGVPSPFKVQRAVKVREPLKKERKIHEILSEHRLPGREFFRVELKMVNNLFDLTEETEWTDPEETKDTEETEETERTEENIETEEISEEFKFESHKLFQTILQLEEKIIENERYIIYLSAGIIYYYIIKMNLENINIKEITNIFHIKNKFILEYYEIISKLKI